jgi:hypothetical protein
MSHRKQQHGESVTVAIDLYQVWLLIKAHDETFALQNYGEFTWRDAIAVAEEMIRLAEKLPEDECA